MYKRTTPISLHNHGILAQKYVSMPTVLFSMSTPSILLQVSYYTIWWYNISMELLKITSISIPHERTLESLLASLIFSCLFWHVLFLFPFVSPLTSRFLFPTVSWPHYYNNEEVSLLSDQDASSIAHPALQLFHIAFNKIALNGEKKLHLQEKEVTLDTLTHSVTNVPSGSENESDI